MNATPRTTDRALGPVDIALRVGDRRPDPRDRLHPLDARRPALHPQRARLRRRRRRDRHPARARRSLPLGRPARPHRLRGHDDHRLGDPGPVLLARVHRQGHRGRPHRPPRDRLPAHRRQPDHGHQGRGRPAHGQVRSPLGHRLGRRLVPSNHGDLDHEAPEPDPRPRRLRRLRRRLFVGFGWHATVGRSGRPDRADRRRPGQCLQPGHVNVAAEKAFSLMLENKDSAPHNVAIYTDAGASKSISIGEIVSSTKATQRSRRSPRARTSSGATCTRR